MKHLTNRCRVYSMIAAGLLMACAHTAPDSAARRVRDTERYSVYAADIERFAVGPETRRVVVEAWTQPFTFSPYVMATRDGGYLIDSTRADADTWHDFYDQDEHQQVLQPDILLGVPVAVVHAPRLEHPFAGPGRGYLVDYPDADGLVYVSVVGFNEAHTEAVVAVSIDTCGALCSHEVLYRLIKRDGRWIVVEELFELWT